MQYSRFFRTMMSLTLAAAMVLCAGGGALATVTEEVIVNDEDVTVNDDINVTTDAPIKDGVTVAAEAHSNDDDASLTVNGNVTAVSEAGGAAAVAVHGRTRPQYYSGAADWDIIREVKKILLKQLMTW